MVISHLFFVLFGRMVLEWRECEHEDVDMEVHDDANTQQMLQRCSLYKFWKIGSLSSQPRLLHMFVDYWDPDTEAFMLDGMPLRIKVEDIYFITGLSYRGKVVNIWDHGVMMEDFLYMNT